jgi:hypothetical protein
VPSDVIWAAIIAGGVGLAGNGVTAWSAYLQAQNQRGLEEDRRRDDRRTALRQERLASYSKLLVAINRLDNLAVGPPAPDAAVNDAIVALRNLLADVRLLGDEDVRAAVETLTDKLQDVGEDMTGVSGSAGTQHKTAFLKHRQEIADIVRAMQVAMRADIGAQDP